MNERDPKLDEVLRAHLREEPPSALDAKILAAAHRAVESAPRKVGPEATRPQRWWMPLAAAAAIGVIAIGVVQQMPKDAAIDATSVPGTTTNAPVQAPSPAPKLADKIAPAEEKAPAPAVAQSQPPAPADKKVAAPASAPAAAPPPPPAAAPARDANLMPKKQAQAEMPRRTEPTADSPPPMVAAPRAAAPPPATASAPAPSPFPAAPAPLQKTEIASAEAKRGEATDTATDTAREAPKEMQVADARKDALANRQAAAGAVAPAPPAAASAPAAPSPQTASSFAGRSRAQESVGALAQNKANAVSEYETLARDPDAWIVRIRKLRDEGNTAQAVRELREFRTLVPDAEKKLPADLRALQP